MNFKKRFSLPNHERPPSKHNQSDSEKFDRLMFDAVSAASDQCRKEISDIYFGFSFRYHHNGSHKKYGEIMGVESSENQLKWLFAIKDKFGIEPSLTLNDQRNCEEIYLDREIRKEFIAFIRSMYDRGLRMCTISNVHLMATGILQNEFPEMIWKNTVNHLITTSQEVVDFAALGYNVILADRSLNRNFNELKQMKRAADKVGVKLSLLSSEGCLPSCPFKLEHDTFSLGPKAYWDYSGHLSCPTWARYGLGMPRVGVDITAPNKELLDQILNSVDYLKYSSRISFIPDGELDSYHPMVNWYSPFNEEDFYVDSYKTIYDQNIEPFDAWYPHPFLKEKTVPFDKERFNQRINEHPVLNIWVTQKGKSLATILSNCRSQCWDCHACERVFGKPDIDTLVGISKPNPEFFDNINKVIPIIPYER